MPLSGGRRTELGRGTDVFGGALSATHAAWMTILPAGIRLNTRALATGRENHRAVMSGWPSGSIAAPTLTANRVLWMFVEVPVTGGPVAELHSEPTSLADDDVVWRRDLTGVTDSGFFALAASDTAVTFTDPAAPFSLTPALWQQEMRPDAAPVRVTCNAGGAVVFDADEDRAVVWLDTTRGRLDVAARQTPVGTC